MTRIRLRFATLVYTPEGALTEFPDDSRYGAQPHDAPHYHALAYRAGYAGDVLAYCREHELAHHLVGEAFNRPSAVLWALAHGEEPDAETAASEEALALALQRYARANEVPMIDRVDWEALRRRMLDVLEAGD